MEKFVSLIKDLPINKTNEKVNCLHPVILTNPLLKEYLYKFGNYTHLGVYHVLPYHKQRCMVEFFPKTYLHPRNMTLDDIDSCFVTNHETGETFPMYIAVPCGHCTICKAAKVDAFAQRCELETQMYNHLPYFITLTFNDRHLPPKGASVRDAQLFLKRFRSNLSYAGFNDHFRYVCVSEYGSKTHRSHLHLLVWNLYPSAEIRFTKIRRILKKSWNKGFTYLTVVSPNYRIKGSNHGLSKPENCFKYVAKYIAKDCVVPFGKNPTFVCTSRRNGGIGAPFIDRHAKYIRQYRRFTFQYIDRFTLNLCSMVYSRYVLSRLFPTYYSSVPRVLRQAVQRLCLSAPFVKHSESYMTLLRQHFNQVFWPLLSRDDLGSKNCMPYDSWLQMPGAKSLFLHNVAEDVKILIKYKDFDFGLAKSLAESRSYITAKLFNYKPVRDLTVRASLRDKFNHLQRQRELF